MPDIDAVMQDNQRAVEELAAAGEQCADSWTRQPAPGKWSPSQVVEHVARALEDSAKAVRGEPSRLPTLPAFIRPLLRKFFLERVVKTGKMGKAKTNKAMDPQAGPPTPAEGRKRLEAAMASFDAACRDRATSNPRFDSGTFGSVSLEDYGRFQAMHTRHHRKQLPA